MRLLLNWSIVREPTLLVTAVIYGLLLQLCVMAGLFGLWLGVLLLTSIWRYNYQVLRFVSQGRKTIPPPDLDSFNLIGEWAVFWHFVLFPGVILATTSYQPLGTLIAVAVAIIFPASAALMSVTSSLAQALNPAAIGYFMRTTGSDYWTLVTGTVVIFGGSSLLVGVVLPALGFTSSLLGIVVTLWALFAAFALIGALLRKHRLEFEIPGEVKPPEERLLELRHKDWKHDLDIAYGAFRSDLLSSGYKTLHDLVDREGDSIDVNFWLVENMLEWQDKRYAFEVAAKLMPRLLDRGDGEAALILYNRCRWRDPDFRLPEEQSLRLGAIAAAFGQTGLAGELGYTPEDLQTR